MVHVADSKVVHSSALGIGAIERSATAILNLANRRYGSLFDLWDDLADGEARRRCGEPWFCGDDLPLPVVKPDDAAASISGRAKLPPSRIKVTTALSEESQQELRPAVPLQSAIERWSKCCKSSRCRLVGVACEIVPAREFNDGVAQCGSKGRVLSERTLRLLRRLWNPADDGKTLVLCDKHGGRDRYAELLAEVFPEELPLGLEESRTISRYRLGKGEVRFQVQSEEHLPVAAASIVAKYVREACMEAFNAYWLARQPALRPTRGYPGDARRFLEAIEVEAADLGLERETYWRSR
jgi:hypothetical protein